MLGRLFLLAAMVAALFMVSTAVAADFTIFMNDENPMNYRGESGRPQGTSVRIISELGRRLGEEYDFRFMEFESAYAELNRPGERGMMSLEKTRQREPWFHWVGPLYCQQLAFYTLDSRKTIDISSLDRALRTPKVAVAAGSEAELLLTELGHPDLRVYQNTIAALRFMKLGEANAVVMGVGGAASLSNSAGIPFRMLRKGVVVRNSVRWLAISKDTPESMAGSWQFTLDGMVRDGTIRRMFHSNNYEGYCGD